METQATYLDGRSAQRHAVQVRLARPLLLITTPDGVPLADWPVVAVRLLAREGPDLRLGRDGQDDRLILRDADAAPLLSALSALQPRGRQWRNAALLAAGTLALVMGLWFGGPLLADGAARLVPRGVAAAIGGMAEQQVVAGERRCAEPAGQAVLEALTARLATAAGMRVPPRVVVVDRAQVNAFAVPGGRILLLHGLLAEASGADEVAGVLAHEIGHLRHEHPLRGLMRALGLGALTSVLTGGSDIAALGTILVTLANTRAFEAEADAEAVRILQAAGIGTAGLRTFLTRMDEGASSSAARYLRSHPPTAERRAGIPQQAGTRPALAQAEWTTLRRICSS
jgi:predicted Zn-dependent protease